ncbi:MAG: hypothetical protein RQ743_13540 [Bacteroidales bacterium]|nr:hypothetical protein [Bacteroidales bacterium]
MKISLKTRPITTGKGTFALMVLLLIPGCVASKIQTVDIRLNKKMASIVVMKPSEAKRRLYATDAARRGPVLVLIDNKTGFYTYTFDEKDYANLRASVINSLEKCSCFNKVTDTPDQDKGTEQMILYLDFYDSGIQKTTWTMDCLLNGTAWIEDSSGKVLAEKQISVLESSGMSVGKAKDKAIIKYLQEISALLEQLD